MTTSKSIIALTAITLGGSLFAAVEATLSTDHGNVRVEVLETLPTDPAIVWSEVQSVNGAKDGKEFSRLGAKGKYGMSLGLKTKSRIPVKAGSRCMISFVGRVNSLGDTFIPYITPYDRNGNNNCLAVAQPSGWRASSYSHTFYKMAVGLKKTNVWETVDLTLDIPIGVAAIDVCLGPWRGNGVDCKGFVVKTAPGNAIRQIEFETRELHADGSVMLANNREALAVELQQRRDMKGATRIEAQIFDRSIPARDRAFDLTMALERDFTGWTFHKDWRNEVVVSNQSVLAFTQSLHGNTVSRFSFSALSHDGQGLAFGTRLDDMTFEARQIIGGRLISKRPVGLIARNGKNGSAKFDWMLFTFDPSWGFRSATAEYYRHEAHKFPNLKPTHREGCWLWPVAPNNLPSNAEDFGLGFWEAGGAIVSPKNREAALRLGIGCYPYTEAWGMRQQSGVADCSLLPPIEDRLNEIRNWTTETNSTQRWFKGPRNITAQALLNSVPQNGKGDYIYVEDRWDTWTTWWRTNSDPRLKSPNRAECCWNYEISPVLERADGVYLDSLSYGFSVDFNNMRREHLEAMTEPLVIDRSLGVPCANGLQHMLAFIDWLANRLHPLNKRIFGNVFGITHRYIATKVDVYGHEVGSWGGKNREQKLTRVTTDREACEVRLYAYHRPISNLLQEGHYEHVSPALSAAGITNYVENQIFYGIYPGVCTIGGEEKVGYAGWRRYFDKARQCERDRELFKAAIPLIRRMNAAGWEPVTYMRSSNPSIYVERYGAMNQPGECFFALRNDSDQPQSAILTVDDAPQSRFDKLTSQWHREVQAIKRGHCWEVTLAPWQTLVLKADIGNWCGL